MLRIRPLEKANVYAIVKWNDGKSIDFLYQWAGHGYQYPLSEQQIYDRLDAAPSGDYKIYEILLDKSMIGTIELVVINSETQSARIGRYLIDPDLTGKGYGFEALKAFVAVVSRDFCLKKLRLFVFDFNRPAIRCYEKVGFKIINREVRPNGWMAFEMEMDPSDSKPDR